MPNPFVRGGLPKAVNAVTADVHGVLVVECPNSDDGLLLDTGSPPRPTATPAYAPITVTSAEAFADEASTGAVRVDLFDSITEAGCVAGTRKTSILIQAARYAGEKTADGEEHVFHRGVFALMYDVAGVVVTGVVRVSLSYVKHSFPHAIGEPIEDALPESIASLRIAATTLVRENPNAGDSSTTDTTPKPVYRPVVLDAYRAWATDAAGTILLYDTNGTDLTGLTPAIVIPLSAAVTVNASKRGHRHVFHKGICMAITGTALAYFTGSVKPVGA
jgi:hypothetical protein